MVAQNSGLKPLIISPSVCRFEQTPAALFVHGAYVQFRHFMQFQIRA